MNEDEANHNGMAPGPYEMSARRNMPVVSTYALNANTVTPLSRIPRTLNSLPTR